MNNLFFATLADFNYKSRVEVMYDSLEKHSSISPVLFLLCIDDKIFNYFNIYIKKKNIKLIKLHDIEFKYNDLKVAKENRSYVEYIFTLSPYLPLYILQEFENVDRVTTLDADIYFLSDPKVAINRLGSDQIGITTHSFPDNLKYLERNGIFNVSFQSFPNNEQGLSCLKEWRANCFDYCGDEPSLGRYADQKYLDFWPEKYNTFIFNFPYLGLAPWNTNNCNLEQLGNKFRFNEGNIILYHFHHFRRINRYIFTFGIHEFNVKNISREILSIYKIYINELKGKENNDKNLLRDNYNTKNSIKKYLLLLNNQVVFILINNRIFQIDIRYKFNYIFNLYEKFIK